MDELITLVATFRACWLAGRPGGGKTLLAVVMALELLRRGFSECIVANVPIHAPGLKVRDVTEHPEDVTDATIILDEAWSELGMGQDKALRRWLAYPRKRNQVLLFPSVLPLVRSLSRFRVIRQFCGTQLGLPLWVYKYVVDTGDRKPLVGRALLWTPSQWYGLYDSFALPQGWVIYESDNYDIEAAAVKVDGSGFSDSDGHVSASGGGAGGGGLQWLESSISQNG